MIYYLAVAGFTYHLALTTYACFYIYLYSELPEWLAVVEKYFLTFIYSISYDEIFFEIFGRFLFQDVPLF